MAVHPDDESRSADEHLVLATDALRGVHGLLMDCSESAGASFQFTRPVELMALVELLAMEFDRASEAARFERASRAA